MYFALLKRLPLSTPYENTDGMLNTFLSSLSVEVKMTAFLAD
jgi:hypothetical protein